MSAETIGPASWAPNPARQRLADYTLEDILDLPDGAPRVELDNGVAVVVPKPTVSHQNNFWRIERDPLHMFAYDLVDGRYEPVGDSIDELVLTAPFEIELPIREITP